MKHIAEQVSAGKEVVFRPRGNSMEPRIHNGQEVRVSPISSPDDLTVGDVVLCKVRGRIVLHLITAKDSTTGRFQISNNKGLINGWTKEIYGKVIE